MDEQPKGGKTLTWVLGILALVLGVGWLFCFVTRPPPGTRPLPVFRGVKVFNGTRGTAPTTVRESHTNGTTAPTTPAPLVPAAPVPNRVAVYTPPPNLSEVKSVSVVILIPPAVAGGNPSPITVTSALPTTAPAGSRIVEVNVILSDVLPAGTDVAATAQFLWYQASGPYWNWDAGSTITGSPCAAPQNSTTPDPSVLPLTEENLFNATSNGLADVVVSFTLSSGASVSTLPTSVTAFGLIGLPAPTYYTDVTTTEGSYSGMTSIRTMSVLDPAKQHFHIAYFFVGPQNAFTSGGIVQSSAAPYWSFK